MSSGMKSSRNCDIPFWFFLITSVAKIYPQVERLCRTPGKDKKVCGVNYKNASKIQGSNRFTRTTIAKKAPINTLARQSDGPAKIGSCTIDVQNTSLTYSDIST